MAKSHTPWIKGGFEGSTIMTANNLQRTAYPDGTRVVLGKDMANFQDILLIILNKELANAIDNVGIMDGNWPDKSAAIAWFWGEWVCHLNRATCYGTPLNKLLVKEVRYPEDLKGINVFLFYDPLDDFGENMALNTGYLTQEQEELLDRADVWNNLPDLPEYAVQGSFYEEDPAWLIHGGSYEECQQFIAENPSAKNLEIIKL